MEMRYQKKLKIAILLADTDFKSTAADKNLMQIYGESILQITYHRIKGLFDKVIVVVNNFDQQSIYAKQIDEDVVVNTHKVKNEVTAALTAFSACKKIPNAELAFLARPNMPLISSDVVRLFLQKMADEKNALIPQHANGVTDPFHGIYRIVPALSAFEKASNDDKSKLSAALSYLSAVYVLPVSEIITADPQLHTFLKVESDVDYQKAKEKLQGKVYKSRIKKAEKISSGVKKELETATTIYFSVPGSSGAHEIMYNKRAKRWNCDCRHFVMRATQCSHIIAAQEFCKKPI